MEGALTLVSLTTLATLASFMWRAARWATCLEKRIELIERSVQRMAEEWRRANR